MLSSGEGISVHCKDFVYLDESEEAKSSVQIQGPSVGSPLCIGRGPLVFRFEIEGKQMGLVCSRAILADVPSGGSIFRLVSAVKMKRHGIRYVSGLFNELDYIECVRTGTKIRLSRWVMCYSFRLLDLLKTFHHRKSSKI